MALTGIVMGSDSDWPLVKKAYEIFVEFCVESEVRVISAHRTPELAVEYAKTAKGRGLKVIIAAAGGAAHLGGILAANTTLPVIGIPVAGGALNGIDALLATLQMPSGIPVATVALGSSGPTNAALLAIQILALSDDKLAARLETYKAALAAKVEKGNAKVNAELNATAKQ